MEESKGIDEGWYLGIDFGTSNTYLVGYYSWGSGKGKLYPTELMHSNIADVDRGIPTVITRLNKVKLLGRNEVIYYIGKEAIEKATKNKLNKCVDLKQKARKLDPCSDTLNESIVFKKGEKGVSRDEVLQAFFSVLIQKANEEISKKNEPGYDPLPLPQITETTIKSIVIGCPNSEGKAIELNDSGSGGKVTVDYGSVLQNALAACITEEANKEALKRKIKVVPEAVLAGIAYLYNSKKDDVILVVDSGGGTTDFALLYWKGDEIQNDFIGEGCDFAGNEIDRTIYKKLFLEEGTSNDKGEDSEMMDKVREAKEHIFRDDKGDPREGEELGKASHLFEINNAKRVLHYNKDEKRLYEQSNDQEEIVRIGEEEVYKKICEKLSEDLKLIKATINTIFFVGGTSYILPLRLEISSLVQSQQGEEKDKSSKKFSNKVSVRTPFGTYTPISISSFVQNTKREETGNRIFFDREHKITCFNAVAIGACIRALGTKIVSCPKIELACETDEEPAWVTIYDPQQESVRTALVDTVDVCAAFANKNDISLYYRSDIPMKFRIRINGKLMEDVIRVNKKVMKDILSDSGKDLVINFSLTGSGTLVCTTGMGTIEKERKGYYVKDKIKTFGSPLEVKL